MMSSSEIRQSFLDFFKSKQHTLVPSSSLLPDAPNLLFTNAGMNQFVPIFLGQKKPDVSKWAGAVPGLDTRAADTQKCIRAGGKHNDLEDVGLDTYHHTFFEMLGNWSFGDYFKKEAIEWAWELVAEVWRFPKHRLYATVYQPGSGEPAEFDQEAWDHWAQLFAAAGLDPKVHIRTGGKKDNFWMMGDTGPCGPCSELHVDLTPAGDTCGALVNRGDARCIEIWNLVFIQFNANPDGTFSPLPARHVDTGMGFERVTAIIQNTKDFTDFTRVISNYETDIFRPIFDKLEQLSGKKYGSTLPSGQSQIADLKSQIAVDVAFRVISDHLRTLGFAIADGIQPGNTDRNYVLRRILRRAVRYGRTLGFHEPFFHKLVDVLADTMGDVFPEIRAKRKHVEEVIRVEEEAFNKTLDRGILMFDMAVGDLSVAVGAYSEEALARGVELAVGRVGRDCQGALRRELSGALAFKLYDEQGFPLDLTELMARERGLTVDVEGFNKLMGEQRARARAAQKKTVVELSQIETAMPTIFVGYDKLETPAKVLEVVSLKDQTAVILDTSACYAEMGGQVGDTGILTVAADVSPRRTSAPADAMAALSQAQPRWKIVNTQKSGHTWLHLLEARSQKPEGRSDEEDAPAAGSEVILAVDKSRREAIQRHHTVTHLLHWALHEVVSHDATQKGSFVGPDKLTFDFNAAPLTPHQVADAEKLVNERILENAPVTWLEVKYSHVKDRRDIMQFFGEKYGEWVRVVQIGGQAAALDGYSMELCGGTHCRAVGEIGLFRITGENAIAAGVRRIEAIAGLEAYRKAQEEMALLKSVAGRVNAPIPELEKRVENLLAQQKELEKQLRALQQKEAAGAAKSLVAKAAAINGIPAIIENLGALDGDALQGLVNELKGQFKGVILLGGVANNAVALVAAVTPEFTAKVQAGKLIQQIAPIVGGKGGGKPDNARGGGKDVTKLDDALAKARTLL
jgi:alanyl-tRNA synthetase